MFFVTDALTNLVGQQNARYGIIKIFNALQEANANKHLLYVRIIFICEALYSDDKYCVEACKGMTTSGKESNLATDVNHS